MSPTGAQATHSVLIVEDDPLLAQLIAAYLESHGFRTAIEGDGARAVARALADLPDALILDVTLPGKDGMTICRELRPQFKGVILMVTSHSDDMDRILGLELGADDYLPKPVEPRLLMAHLKACLRRLQKTETRDTAEELQFGALRISNSKRTVHLRTQEVELQSAEFDLLWLLASHAGQVRSRDQIMSGMRGILHDGVDRSIDMRVSRLRKALGDDPTHPQHIKTVRGKGYLFVDAEWA